MGWIGLVSNWSGTGPIVNGTTRLATTYTDDGLIVKPRIYTLANGVKVHYDGATAALTTWGTVTQEFIDSGGPTYINTLRSNMGHYGTLTLTDVNLANPATATAILVAVNDVTPVQGSRAKVWCACTWELLTGWA